MAILIENLKQIIFRPVSLILFLLPIAGAVGFGSFLEKEQSELVIPVAIVDKDQSNFSEHLIKQLKEQPRILFQEVSASQADTLLSRNEVDSVFVIKKHFQTRLLDEKRDETIELWTSPSSVASGVVREVAAGEITKMTSAIKAANRVVNIYKRTDQDGVPLKTIWNEAFKYTNSQWEPKPLMTIDYIQEGNLKHTKRSSNKIALYAPYLGVWSFFIMMSCFVTADWVVRERSKVFARIVSTSRGLSSYLMQTAGAHIIFHIVQAICSFWVLSKMDFVQSNFLLLIGMVLFIFFSTGLAMFTASRMRNNGTYYVMSMLIVFIIAVCGGSFFSMADLSASLETISHWLPQKILWNTAYSAEFYDFLNPALFMAAGALILWRLTIWGMKVR
jgi:ABC-2 type transport system permease protein